LTSTTLLSGFVFFGSEPVVPVVFLSVPVTTGFGLRCEGLGAVEAFAGFSFGREVRKAPRTSSCCGAIGKALITNAEAQSSPNKTTLNLINSFSLIKSLGVG